MDRSMGARYNNYSPTRQTGTSVFNRPNLAPGSYSVSVSHAANTSGINFSFARLAIDAIRVYKAESLSAAPLFWGATGNGGSGTWDIGATANWNDGGQATAWHDFGGTDYRSVFGGSAGSVNLASGSQGQPGFLHTPEAATPCKALVDALRQQPKHEAIPLRASRPQFATAPGWQPMIE